jgi:ABC-type Zn uptake system ZnuABC Zn-binding protein ZnuA
MIRKFKDFIEQLNEANAEELKMEINKLDSDVYSDLLNVKTSVSNLIFTEYFQVIYTNAISIVKITSNEYLQTDIDKFNKYLIRYLAEKNGNKSRFVMDNAISEMQSILDKDLYLVVDLNDEQIASEYTYQKEILEKIIKMDNVEEFSLALCSKIYNLL